MNINRKMNVNTIGFNEIFENDEGIRIRLSVPQYQRDYSWEESHIYDLLESICNGRDTSEQSIFLGTMLFDQVNKDEFVLDIVDGQQRITTLLLLIHFLDMQLNKKSITDDMLPEVNNGNTNKELFKYAWDLKDIDDIRACKQGKAEVANMNNRYERCLLYIKAFFTSIIDEEELTSENIHKKGKKDTDKTCTEFYDKILKVIFNNIFFVRMITVERPLPQVVQIFNTINSTGMDLNCSDLFKLQYYEYLKNKEDSNLPSDEILPQINKCYEAISALNNTGSLAGVIRMNDFLDIYKHILCTCFVSKSIWSWLKKSNETFFDDLFSNIPNENKAKFLTFNNFKKAIDIYIELFKIMNDKTDQTLCHIDIKTFLSPKMLETTRYSRYWTIPYVYSFLNIHNMSDTEQRHAVYIKALEFTEELYKYFMVQSICYDKVINPVQTFVCDTVLKGLKQRDDTIISAIKEKINTSPYEWQRNNAAHVSWINERLYGNIYANYTRARIICVLSAIIDEENSIKDGNNASYFDTKNHFFNWDEYKYDLEHIYSQKEFTDKTDINLFNSLGNLVILERRINRRLSNKSVNG